MPKVSFAQAITEMERVLTITRSNAGSLPPLALEVADELEARIAEAKERKVQQRDLLAKQMATTETLTSVMAQGSKAARRLRSYVVLALGTKHPQLPQFGISVRGRRRRKARKAAPPASGPLADIPVELAAATEPLETAAEPSDAAPEPLEEVSNPAEPSLRARAEARGDRADESGVGGNVA